MTDTSVTLPPETKAAITALLTQCFRAARNTDRVLMREPERDDNGELRGYSWEQTEALDDIAERLGIDLRDVSAPVVAEERKAS